MLISCYSCKLSFSLLGYNPFRQTAICPICGAHVHVAEAAKRAYGDKIGEQVAKILTALTKVKTRSKDDYTFLADAALARVEGIFTAAEQEHTVATRSCGGVDICAPTRQRVTGKVVPFWETLLRYASPKLKVVLT
jgi:hypothetical protein